MEEKGASEAGRLQESSKTPKRLQTVGVKVRENNSCPSALIRMGSHQMVRICLLSNEFKFGVDIITNKCVQ
jgi:hypothetical protein